MGDNQVLDLLDYALSTNIMDIVCTLRELLTSNIMLLMLMSRLSDLIIEILAGSLEINRDAWREGFFNRNLCKCCLVSFAVINRFEVCNCF